MAKDMGWKERRTETSQVCNEQELGAVHQWWGWERASLYFVDGRRQSPWSSPVPSSVVPKSAGSAGGVFLLNLRSCKQTSLLRMEDRSPYLVFSCCWALFWLLRDNWYCCGQLRAGQLSW
jgi:hypothetical protein